ncbi:hypothetical protein IAT38_002418 [Cryptococcus sp. DSM 104549]
MRLNLALLAIALTFLSEAFARDLVVPVYLHSDVLCYTGTTTALGALTFSDASSSSSSSSSKGSSRGSSSSNSTSSTSSSKNSASTATSSSTTTSSTNSSSSSNSTYSGHSHTSKRGHGNSGSSASCTSQYYINCLALSLNKYCPKYVEYGWSTFTASCASSVAIKGIDVVLAAIDTANVTEVSALTSGTKVNGNAIIDQASFDLGYKTVKAAAVVTIEHHAFGWSIYILVALAVFVGLFRRIYSSYLTHIIVSAGATNNSETAPVNSFWSKTNDKYMRWLGMPSLFSKRHVKSYAWFSLPTRLEGVCIFIYCFVNVMYDLAAYNIFTTYSGKQSLAQYIADRTGIGCFYHLPLLWILAGRNDFILWLTGWSFASMNIFHRWVARICTFQALAHTIGYLYQDRAQLANMWARMYWRAGVGAMITMFLLVFPLSIKPFREKSYEIFLILHIFLAVASLVLCFFHVSKYQGSYDSFLWVCVGVWCFDRFARYVRVGVLSYKAAAGNNAELIATGGPEGLIRLTVTSSTRFTPKPGQHFYLYTPKSIKPWENHPFTLGSWETGPKGETRLHFLFGSMAGATRRLRRQVEAVQTGGSAACRVLVEGPYGHSCPVQRYDHALFIAGGSGITASLPYLHDLLERSKTGKAVTKRVTMVWVVKNNEYAEDVLAHELARMQGVEGFEFSLHIYITASSGLSTPLVEEAKVQHLPYSDSTGSGSSTPSLESPATSTYEKDEKRRSASLGEGIHTGRPEMAKVLAESLSQMVGSETLAVMACGPGSMMDDMRSAVCDAYGTGEGQVSSSRLEYFEESFSW